MKWIIGRRSDEGWLYWVGNGRTWSKDKSDAGQYTDRAKALFKRRELKQWHEGPVWVMRPEN